MYAKYLCFVCEINELYIIYYHHKIINSKISNFIKYI